MMLIKDTSKTFLRKINVGDKKYFSRWWKDKELLKLTSGILKTISDSQIDKYFADILHSKKDYHYMITLDNKVIGHISLARRHGGWYETQIVIGEKKYWGKGYGTRTIKLLLKKAKRLKISKIYLEVRPTNARAIRAYEHCGFKKTKTTLHPKNKFLPKTLRMKLVEI